MRENLGERFKNWLDQPLKNTWLANPVAWVVLAIVFIFIGLLVRNILGVLW
jgi:hypothetical protein